MLKAMTTHKPAQGAPAARPATQTPDQALADRLQALRKARGLSVADMAQALGLWGANGADNLRQMERGARPLPGTLQVLLGYMERETELQELAARLDPSARPRPVKIAPMQPEFPTPEPRFLP